MRITARVQWCHGAGGRKENWNIPTTGADQAAGRMVRSQLVGTRGGLFSSWGTNGWYLCTVVLVVNIFEECLQTNLAQTKSFYEI